MHYSYSQHYTKQCSYTNCFNPPGAKITLGDSFYKRSEGDGYVDVCVHLKTEIKRDIDFELDANGLTAQGKIQTEAL